MNAAYRQNNFVDFYFQYIGRPIPVAFKAPLLASTDNELNSDLITQLYIVSARILFIVLFLLFLIFFSVFFCIIIVIIYYYLF